MIQAILNFFGLGKKETTSQPLTEGITRSGVKAQCNINSKRPQPPARPPIKKASVNAKKYYRRNGNYYSIDDNSLIEDLMLLVILNELFDDGGIGEYEGEINSEDVAEDLLDVDVSDTIVTASVREEVNWSVDVPADNTPEPATYTPDPEPIKQESYSSGYSDSSSSSSYDSDSSDSGGSDD